MATIRSKDYGEAVDALIRDWQPQLKSMLADIHKAGLTLKDVTPMAVNHRIRQLTDFDPPFIGTGKEALEKLAAQGVANPLIPLVVSLLRDIKEMQCGDPDWYGGFSEFNHEPNHTMCVEWPNLTITSSELIELLNKRGVEI
jgi:hypothetical protein